MSGERCPEPMMPHPAAVIEARRDAPDVVTLTAKTPPAYAAVRPGQFSMLYAFGIGEIPISVTGDAAQADRLVHTIKGVGAVSRALCRLQRGDVLGLRGPYGRGWPLEQAPGSDLLLIAGGIGLAPLIPVVHAALDRRSVWGRVVLLAGARTPDDFLHRDQLEAWGRSGEVTVVTTVDRAGPGWRGRVGVVPALLADIAFTPDRTVAFICGPEVMMRFTIRELTRRGLTDAQIHLSMERNMECAIGLCGHCQFGPSFICKDGPVLRYDRIRPLLAMREI